MITRFSRSGQGSFFWHPEALSADFTELRYVNGHLEIPLWACGRILGLFTWEFQDSETKTQDEASN